MNKVMILGAVGLVAFGFGVGAVSGYMTGAARLSDFGKTSGVIIRGLCKNEGYDGAYYPLDNPSEARCVTEAQLAELTSTD